MTQKEKLSAIIKALDSKKAENIKAIKIGDLTIIADYFVIANGTSTTHAVLPTRLSLSSAKRG